jgi:hypothetical protein
MFDSALNDPTTVVFPASSRPCPYWRDLEYLPEFLIQNLAINLSSAILTPIQEKFLSSITSTNKVYSIISPPNTGTTTALVIYAIQFFLSNPSSPSILWISHSSYSLLSAKELFLKLNPQINIKTDVPDETCEVYMFPADKPLNRKRAETYILGCTKKFSLVVLDGAEEILSITEIRKWMGGNILMKVYSECVGSLPITLFSQFYNSTIVGTFVTEVDKMLQQHYRLCTYPLQISNEEDTFAPVKQYYCNILDDRNWLKRLLCSITIPLRKGVLVFGNKNNLGNIESINPIGCINGDNCLDEAELFQAVSRIRNSEKKVLIRSKNLDKRFKTCGFGCVIHAGFPVLDNEIDIKEYRARVERVFSPKQIGISIVVCRETDQPLVSSCSHKLNISLERFPL